MTGNIGTSDGAVYCLILSATHLVQGITGFGSIIPALPVLVRYSYGSWHGIDHHRPPRGHQERITSLLFFFIPPGKGNLTPPRVGRSLLAPGRGSSPLSLGIIRLMKQVHCRRWIPGDGFP